MTTLDFKYDHDRVIITKNLPAGPLARLFKGFFGKRAKVSIIIDLFSVTLDSGKRKPTAISFEDYPSIPDTVIPALLMSYGFTPGETQGILNRIEQGYTQSQTRFKQTNPDDLVAGVQIQRLLAKTGTPEQA